MRLNLYTKLKNNWYAIDNKKKKNTIKLLTGATLVTTLFCGCLNKEKNDIDKKSLEPVKNEILEIVDEDNELEVVAEKEEDIENILLADSLEGLENVQLNSENQNIVIDNDISNNIDGEVNISTDNNTTIEPIVSSQIEAEEDDIDLTNLDNIVEPIDSSISVFDEVIESSIEEENQNVDTISIDVPTYCDPQGNYWVSEADYYIWLTGEVFDASVYFTAPDGSYWDSEELYLDYINNANNGFKDPQGNYWVSEAEYNEYISIANESVLSEIDSNDNLIIENDCYVDSEGYYWETEADYNMFMNQNIVEFTR